MMGAPAATPERCMSRKNRLFDLRSEDGVLRLSIAATVLVAGLGIGFGLFARSFAIAFDGIYSLIDAGMSLITLMAANLINSYATSTGLSRKLRERFSFGFWHLEPMLLVLNGTLQMGAALYALVNAVDALLNDGRPMAFGWAIAYASITLVVCLAAGLRFHHANRRIGSEFVRLDARAWLMSGAITGALLLAFILGHLATGTRWEPLTPYIDPAILAVVCLLILPLPAGAIRRGLADIFRITPADLKHHIDEVGQAAVAEYGFLSHRAYVARMGREIEVELYFIVPHDYPALTIPQWDALRDIIGDRIGEKSPHRWLTIAFTADPEWAE